MLRKYALPLAAVTLFGLAMMHVVRAQQVPPKQSPLVEPPTTPFSHAIAGAGIVEAQTENIAVGAHLPGVVTEVHVKVGQKVKAGTPLFRLDDRQLRAELKVREATLAVAETQLTRLEAMPRPEELPSSKARMDEAQENLVDQDDQVRRARTLFKRLAIGEEELVRREQAYRMAKEQHARAQADYELLKAGAWKPDKDITAAQAEQARAQVAQTRTELDRLVVTAQVDGEVLQVNVRPGEYVGTPAGQALVVLGDVQRLHVRADLDEHDIPRFRADALASAHVRGAPAQRFGLKLVRLEPYVVPKRSLTGDSTERVDTRVLQVIYAVEPGGPRLYVGQQVDVFVDAAK